MNIALMFWKRSKQSSKSNPQDNDSNSPKFELNIPSSSQSSTITSQKQSFQQAKGSAHEPIRNIQSFDFWRQPNVGIPNIGNTCYLNSAIQGLTYCSAFTNELLNSPFASQDSQYSIFKIDEKQSYQMNPKIIRQFQVENSQNTNLPYKISGIGAKIRENDYFNWFALARAVIEEMLSLRINGNTLSRVSHTSQDMEQPKYSSSYSYSYYDESIQSCVSTSIAQKVQSSLGQVNNDLIGYGQQDSHEALIAILDSLHEVTFDIEEQNIHQKLLDDNKENKNEKEKEQKQSSISAPSTPSTMSREGFSKVWEEYKRLCGSYVTRTIMGLSATGIYCKNCHNLHHSYQPFNVLSLNLPIVQDSSSFFSLKPKVKCSIMDLLKNYNRTSNVEGLKCEFCHKTTEVLRFKFLAHWPKVLILQINRFIGGMESRAKKDTTPVDIPIIIQPNDILNCFESSPFLQQFAEHLIPPYQEYILTSVVYHSGSISSGHYTCVGRLANGKWMKHSDSSFYEEDEPTTSSDAYILFYTAIGDGFTLLRTNAQSDPKQGQQIQSSTGKQHISKVVIQNTTPLVKSITSQKDINISHDKDKLNYHTSSSQSQRKQITQSIPDEPKEFQNKKYDEKTQENSLSNNKVNKENSNHHKDHHKDKDKIKEQDIGTTIRQEEVPFNASWKQSDFGRKERLGKGSFSTVWLAVERSTGLQVVQKEMDYYSDDEKEMVNKEKTIMLNIIQTLKQQQQSFLHLVQPLGFFINEDKSKAFLILEYCQGGNLRKFINNLKSQKTLISIEFAWSILAQVAFVIGQLHQNRIIHGNVKPENILLTNDLKVKLSDFGLAHKLQDEREYLTSFGGLNPYLSPELIQAQNADEIEKEKERSGKMKGLSKKRFQTTAADIWAFGVIMYELLAQKHPFIDAMDGKSGISLGKLIRRVVTEQPPQLPNNYPENMKNLIKRMLEKDPIRRITAEAILAVPQVATNILRN